MTKLLLIDGNAIMHRAFHALPPLTTKKGEPIGAVYGFITMLLRLIEDLTPTHIVVCFDRKEPTFRKKLSTTYQAHRPKMDEGLIPQFPKIHAALSAMNIPVYDKAGYEADDLIGTISHSIKSHQSSVISHQSIDEVDIITADRDILQLVGDKVKVFLPVKGLSQGRLMDTAKVKETLGVAPEQIIDYKALVGDPSDNYPGVPGIGPKTAVSLLEKYGSLENIYANLDKTPKALRQKLQLGKDSALLSQNLARIVTDIPLEFDPAQASAWCLDSSQALSLLENEFGFKTIPARIKKLSRKLPSRSQTSLF